MPPVNPGHAAVLVPGRAYPADAPLLMYARLAVERRGGAVHGIAWEPPPLPTEAAQRAWVAAQVTGGIGELETATGCAAPVLVGKSLGSLAAPVAADLGLAAVWLTPLLTDEVTVGALRRATAPFLLVGGTADSAWDGGTARSVTRHVLEVEGADHAMLRPGELARSAEVLGRVATAVERFLDEVVWVGAA